MVSIIKVAFQQGSWLALFRFVGQLFSWVCTIWVARILVPEDYGLMTMATILTGYAMLFCDLGLGAAIIQKPNPTEEELSSLFWFCLGFSILLSLMSFLLAYPTAYIFNNDALIPVTQTVSILFALSGLQIVPFSLLTKTLSFKKSGFIELIGILTSSVVMLIVAYSGGGVWTLLLGNISRSLTSLILVYFVLKWIPKFKFNYVVIKPYFKLGIIISAGNTVFYIFEKSDKYFAARAWSIATLGYYDLALQLARIPNDKIVSLINTVSFPVYSKMQNDEESLNNFFLKSSKLAAAIVLPLYMGGFMLSDTIVSVLLDEKWKQIVFVFKWLCLVQIVTVLGSFPGRVHIAKGRPRWVLYYNFILATLMAISFYFAVDYGLDMIIVPWVTTYIIINFIWIILSLKEMKIDLAQYFKNFYNPAIATLIIAIILFACQNCDHLEVFMEINLATKLILKVTLGGFIYFLYMYLFDLSMLEDLKKILK